LVELFFSICDKCSRNCHGFPDLNDEFKNDIHFQQILGFITGHARSLEFSLIECVAQANKSVASPTSPHIKQMVSRAAWQRTEDRLVVKYDAVLDVAADPNIFRALLPRYLLSGYAALDK
jgi:hypothetical protein